MYSIHVCLFCGAQVLYEGGVEGEGWVFDCGHGPFSEEYGRIEPAEIEVEAPAGLAAALEAARAELEVVRERRAVEKAERAAREAARRAALSPEEREREDARREASMVLHRQLTDDLVKQLNRQSFLDRLK